ncbi:MAG: hypothetical protein ACON4N_04515 [Myxococcota bacterium]
MSSTPHGLVLSVMMIACSTGPELTSDPMPADTEPTPAPVIDTEPVDSEPVDSDTPDEPPPVDSDDGGLADTAPQTPLLKGRWVVADLLNTMYLFDGQNRRTFYCIHDDPSSCDDAYWASLELSDAIPESNPYTFDGTTLTIDLHFGNLFEQDVIFLCDGDKLTFSGMAWAWNRVGGDLSDCAE